LPQKHGVFLQHRFIQTVCYISIGISQFCYLRKIERTPISPRATSWPCRAVGGRLICQISQSVRCVRRYKNRTSQGMVGMRCDVESELLQPVRNLRSLLNCTETTPSYSIASARRFLHGFD
jgi:hypothetical protein